MNGLLCMAVQCDLYSLCSLSHLHNRGLIKWHDLLWSVPIQTVDIMTVVPKPTLSVDPDQTALHCYTNSVQILGLIKKMDYVQQQKYKNFPAQQALPSGHLVSK